MAAFECRERTKVTEREDGNINQVWGSLDKTGVPRKKKKITEINLNLVVSV